MPVFTILVFLGGALLWILLPILFRPLGMLVHQLFKDVVDAMSDDEQTNETTKI